MTATEAKPATSGVTDATLADLAAPTPPEEIKSRVAYGKGGPQTNPDGTIKMLDYVDARFVQDRLDSVVGPANWSSQFEGTGLGGSVRGGIAIRVNGEWVWKWDVGTPSNIEPEKGAHSDAFKRAAVQWGIGRDLYSNREDALHGEPAAPTATVQQAVSNGGARGGRYTPTFVPVEPPAPPAFTQEELETMANIQSLAWDCPVHGVHKIVPPGISRAGRPYGAFFGCTDRACKQTGPSIRTPKAEDYEAAGAA